MKPSYLLNVILVIALVVLGIRLANVNTNNKETEAKVASTSDQENGKEPQVVGETFQPWNITEAIETNPFQFYCRPGGLILCAGNREKSNAMAIGWGTLGTLWQQPVATVFVAEGRYTHQFMEKADYFTIMAFDDKHVLEVMGSKSGRDMDKAKECGLHISYTENGTPYYDEANFVIECKTMYSAPFDPKAFRDDVPRNLYSNFPAGLHTEYVGKVVKAMKK